MEGNVGVDVAVLSAACCVAGGGGEDVGNGRAACGVWADWQATVIRQIISKPQAVMRIELV